MRWAVLTALFALPALAEDVSAGSAVVTPPPLPRSALGGGSASRMMMGIRASFGGETAVTEGLGTVVSSLNGVLFLTDQLALIANVGFGLGSVNNANGVGTSAEFGFQLGGGVDYYFRDPSTNLRPVIGGVVAIFKNFYGDNLGNGTVTTSDVGISLLATAGLAYFFAPNFSVDARLAVGLPIVFGNQLSISLFTLTPGLGATVLF